MIFVLYCKMIIAKLSYLFLILRFLSLVFEDFSETFKNENDIRLKFPSIFLCMLLIKFTSTFFPQTW